MTKRERIISELRRAKVAAALLHGIAEAATHSCGLKVARMNASNYAAMIQGLLSGVIRDLERDGK